MKLEQIYFALESQYVPYFIIQKIFLQLDDFYRPNYELSLQEIQPLQKIVNDVSMYPSNACILFIPHNTIRKQRLMNDKISSEKLESRSFMQIRFDQCPHCTKFYEETKKQCFEIRKKYNDNLENHKKSQTLTEQAQKQIDQLYFQQLQKLKSDCKNSQLQHEYYIKISFSDLFYYLHTQKGQENLIDKRGQLQEWQLRTFEIFEKVLKNFKSNELQQVIKFNHEKQQITYKYQTQVDLELTILTFLSLIYQLHFIFQYYYYFSGKLSNQQAVEIKYNETQLKKDNVVMQMTLQTIPYEIQLYVEYEKLGLIVFNAHVKQVVNPSYQQRNIVNESSKIFILLQNWLLKAFMMNSYMKQDQAFAYLFRGNKLIQWLQRDENKSQKIINLFPELVKLHYPIFNFDLTTYEDEDQYMKEMLIKQLSQQNMQSNPSEYKFKKLFEINFDIDKKNQLILYIDGSYAFFSFYIDSNNKRTVYNQRFDQKLNIFSDNPNQLVQFLNLVVV